ncbi:MAG: hypothetical protein ACLQVK_23000 [Acidimicrobiales bacterium]
MATLAQMYGSATGGAFFATTDELPDQQSPLSIGRPSWVGRAHSRCHDDKKKA